MNRSRLQHLPEFAGVALIIVAVLYWMVSGRQSVVVMMSAVALIAVGIIGTPPGRNG